MTELQNCPFCGGDGEIALRHIGGTGSSGMETPEPFARCKSGCVEMNPVRCTDWPYGRKSKIPTGAQARKIAITAWNTRAMVAGEPVAVKCPWCATCGKDVPEVLCHTCAKWWADNHPAAVSGALVDCLFKTAALIGHAMPMTTTALVAGETLLARDVWEEACAILEHKGTEHG